MKKYNVLILTDIEMDAIVACGIVRRNIDINIAKVKVVCPRHWTKATETYKRKSEETKFDVVFTLGLNSIKEEDRLKGVTYINLDNKLKNLKDRGIEADIKFHFKPDHSEVVYLSRGVADITSMWMKDVIAENNHNDAIIMEDGTSIRKLFHIDKINEEHNEVKKLTTLVDSFILSKWVDNQTCTIDALVKRDRVSRELSFIVNYDIISRHSDKENGRKPLRNFFGLFDVVYKSETLGPDMFDEFIEEREDILDIVKNYNEEVSKKALELKPRVFVQDSIKLVAVECGYARYGRILCEEVKSLYKERNHTVVVLLMYPHSVNMGRSYTLCSSGDIDVSNVPVVFGNKNIKGSKNYSIFRKLRDPFCNPEEILNLVVEFNKDVDKSCVLGCSCAQ